MNYTKTMGKFSKHNSPLVSLSWEGDTMGEVIN